jgi:hypothetical protein
VLPPQARDLVHRHLRGRRRGAAGGWGELRTASWPSVGAFGCGANSSFMWSMPRGRKARLP